VQTIVDDALGVLIYEEPVAPKQVIDGLSKTACIAETAVRRQTESEWVNGQNIFAQDESTPINGRRAAGNEIGSPHPGGASLAFCDAHVEFLAESIEQAVLNAMLTRAGGEP
jgi:prepilin-type processing-associated H-X9-DG protein